MEGHESRRRDPLKRRLRYRFEAVLSRGTSGLVLGLAVATAALVLLAALILAVSHVAVQDSGRVGFLEAVWLSLLRTLDPGTMGSDAGWPFRIVSLMVTLGGIFIVSALIGVISSSLDRKLEDLRKGRSPVLEQGHTLLLGWSPKVATIISELVEAHANQPGGAVVVMAPLDKVRMHDEIAKKVPDTGRIRVICRTGEPSDLGDLAIVRPGEAKAVIVVRAPDEGGDAHVVRTLLALMGSGHSFERTHVVAEVAAARTAAALRAAGGDRVLPVVSNDIVARITAQVCRQAGLGTVYQDLLDFEGDEIYFQPQPALDGRTFGDALLAFEDSAVIGIRSGDGAVRLSPPMTTVLDEGQQLIGITADDDTFVVNRNVSAESAGTALPPGSSEIRPEHILIFGWNQLGPRALEELDHHLAPGSAVRVVIDPGLVHAGVIGSVRSPGRLPVTVRETDTAQGASVVAAIEECPTDHIVILCYRRGLTEAEADAHSLMTLLHVHRLLEERPELRERISVVVELLEVQDVPLAKLIGAHDFIVSERLVSLLMSQLAENADMGRVFGDLLDADGAEIYFRPVSVYLPLGTEVDFAAAVAAARDRGEVAIGYRLAPDGSTSEEGVVLNPRKSTRLTFGRDDQLLVLSHGVTVETPNPAG